MIGQKIAERRNALGWDVRTLAERAHIELSMLYAFERGDKKDCNVSTARRIARALGCGIDYLAETWDPSVDPDPEPATRQEPRKRPRGRPRKRPLAAAEAAAQP